MYQAQNQRGIVLKLALLAHYWTKQDSWRREQEHWHREREDMINKIASFEVKHEAKQLELGAAREHAEMLQRVLAAREKPLSLMASLSLALSLSLW